MNLYEMFERGWDNFLARPEGPMSIRFIVQPLLASFIAFRAGLRDATNHRPPYLWAAFSNDAYRTDLIHSGWKDVRIPIFIGTTLDIVYQLTVQHWIYPIELILTVTLLVFVPYIMLRGPVSRIATALSRKQQAKKNQ